MKIWLDELKEGDEFYFKTLGKIHKCKHLGDAHNPNFRMSRIKYKMIDVDNTEEEPWNELVFEAFVNQYVYDSYEAALSGYADEGIKKLEKLNETLRNLDGKRQLIVNEIERTKKLIENAENNKDA